MNDDGNPLLLLLFSGACLPLLLWFIGDIEAAKMATVIYFVGAYITIIACNRLWADYD